MCRIFAGQDPESYAYRTRSLRLNGHSTSLRLEDRFWRLLDEIAAAEGVTTPKFISTLHDEVIELGGETRNFTSLLRCACLVFMEQKLAQEAGEEAGEEAAPQADPERSRDSWYRNTTRRLLQRVS